MSKNLYIVPYDFTSVTEKAVEFALFLGRKVSSEIRLLHIAKDRASAILKVKEIEDVKNKLNIPEGLTVSTHVSVGDIFVDIGKIAAELNAQLIIMGTHGLKGKQYIFGGNAMKILKSVNTPFLIVQDTTEIKEINDLVIPIDLTKESMQIISIAGDMSSILKAKVNVITERQSDEMLKIRLKNRLSIIETEYKERGIDANIEYVQHKGSYDAKIIDYSIKNNIGLIALAYHSESLFPQFDNFAQKLITNKPALPVLIVNSKLASALYF